MSFTTDLHVTLPMENLLAIYLKNLIGQHWLQQPEKYFFYSRAVCIGRTIVYVFYMFFVAFWKALYKILRKAKK